MTTTTAAVAAREAARNTTNGQFGEQNLADPGNAILGAGFPADDFEEGIEARAEALCNLHGEDPNDPDAWAEALDQARDEWNDPHQRHDAYPEAPGSDVPVRAIERRAEQICGIRGLDLNKERHWNLAMQQALDEWDDPDCRDDAYADIDLPPVIRTGPITNLADLCLTGPDWQRFTNAALDKIEHDGAGGEWAVAEQWNLVNAKRLADKVARLFPGATRVRLTPKMASSNSRVMVAEIEPYGPIDYSGSTDTLHELLNEDADQLSMSAVGWRRRCDGEPGPRARGVTFEVARMQAITAADLDACIEED